MFDCALHFIVKWNIDNEVSTNKNGMYTHFRPCMISHCLAANYQISKCCASVNVVHGYVARPGMPTPRKSADNFL